MSTSPFVINSANGIFTPIGWRGNEKIVPAMLGFSLNFAAQALQSLDIQYAQQSGQLPILQTIFIDNSQSDVELILSFPSSLQQITAKGRTQGYYPVVLPVGCHQILMNQPAGGQVVIELLTVAVQGVVWPTA